MFGFVDRRAINKTKHHVLHITQQTACEVVSRKLQGYKT